MKRPVWCAAFLAAIAEPEHLGNVSLVAGLVGRSRNAIYLRRHVDPTFARDMDAALSRCELALTALACHKKSA